MEIDDQGVVNPLRPPRWFREFGRRAVSLPAVGRLFLVLVVLDLAAWIVVFHGASWAAVASVLKVLAPVAVVWRSPAARIGSSWAFVGVVLIAGADLLTTLVRATDAALAPSLVDVTPGPDAARAVLAMALLVLSTAGWVLVARSIARARPATPGWPTSLGFVAAGIAVATGAVGIALDWMAATQGSFGPSFTGIPVIESAVASAAWFVTAWVIWVLGSRAGSAPRAVHRLAAAAGVLWSIDFLPSGAIGLIVIATRSDSWVGAQALAIWWSALAGAISAALILVALANGLLDDTTGRRSAPAGS